jgi:hypothetical protein
MLTPNGTTNDRTEMIIITMAMRLRFINAAAAIAMAAGIKTNGATASRIETTSPSRQLNSGVHMSTRNILGAHASRSIPDELPAVRNGIILIVGDPTPNLGSGAHAAGTVRQRGLSSRECDGTPSWWRPMEREFVVRRPDEGACT